MIGLMMVLFFAVYLAVSVALTVTVAVRVNRHPWLWGGLTAFVMYNLVFWDWIPTLVLHKHYCDTQAGFWVYKTPEQWKKENPGAIETLVANKRAPSERRGDMKNYTDTYLLNSRFNWVVKRTNYYLDGFRRHEQQVVDTKNKEVLARYVDFSTGYGNMMTSQDWRAMKFWMVHEHCSGGGQHQDSLRNFRNNFMGAEND